MTYTPTKEELEEMGFRHTTKNHWLYVCEKSQPSARYRGVAFDYHIEYTKWGGHWRWFGHNSRFYPTSKKDIETLIRLFSKNIKINTLLINK